jgi:thiamine biosynthesis lipoprotein
MIIRCKPLLGTFVEIRIEEESSVGFCAIEEAFSTIEEIQKSMSFFDPESEISKLNKEAHLGQIKVSARTFKILNFAKELYRLCDGVFDVTLHRSAKNTSFEDVEIYADQSIFFRKKLAIDLGGIAKGYAADCAAEAIESFGIKNYLINAGGDLRVGKKTKKINIRNPKNIHQSICEAEIFDGSLATSSGYFSSYKNSQKNFYPIFKSSKNPLEYKDESASIFSKECMIADALTKVALITKEKSKQIIQHFNAQAMIINESGEIYFIN